MADTDPDSAPSESHVHTILVVDDDESVGDFVVTALAMEASTYRALLVPDAAQALETVKTVIPNLVVLDYHLPGINGLELADRLRALDVLKSVPILLMSANPPKQELEKRQIAFLEKPFELEHLVQAIRKLLAE